MHIGPAFRAQSCSDRQRTQRVAAHNRQKGLPSVVAKRRSKEPELFDRLKLAPGEECRMT